MREYVIITDSCSDLSKEWREQYNIDYVPMHVSIDGKEYFADLDWKDVSVKEFYDGMRNGSRIKTAQITQEEYEAKFKTYLEDGKDILYIGCSGALSASIKSSINAKDSLSATYPDSKIICIDSLNACLGLGMLCIIASKKRANGETIEQVAEWIELNKKKVNQECTVEKLTYFKQAGRVSAANAFFGGIFQVKPIVISDANGMNSACEKVKGRGNSLVRVAERAANAYEKSEYNMVFVVNADSEEDGNKLLQLVKEKIGDDSVEYLTGTIGPIIGGTAGPGTVAIYLYGKQVTYVPTK